MKQDLFHGSSTDTHAFSFATVYINLRQIQAQHDLLANSDESNK